MAMPSLTTFETMQRQWSLYGLISFSDHDGDGVRDDGVVEDCIIYANGYVAGKLVQRYKPDVLIGSQLIQEIATVIGIRTLCPRRGNTIPASLELRYQEYTAEGGTLDQIASGKLKLVDSNGEQIVGKASYYPAFSNLTVDRRYRTEQIRVIQSSSMPVNSKLERDNLLGDSNNNG